MSAFRRRTLLGTTLLLGACAERTASVTSDAGRTREGDLAPGRPEAPADVGPFVPATAPSSMPHPDAMASSNRALMAARIADGPELAMILADHRGAIEQWLAPGPFVLGLRSGRITRTVNLPGTDLKGVVDETADPLLHAGRLLQSQGESYRRRLQTSGAPPGGLVVESRLAIEGSESVRTPGLGQSRVLRRVREAGRGLDESAGAWRFENLFWLEPGSGRVIASRQELLPGAPTLTLNLINAG